MTNFIKFSVILISLASPILAKEKASLPKELPFKLGDLETNKTNEGNTDTQAKKMAYRISGQVASSGKSSLSFMVPGFIQKIDIKPGDIIKKGDILAVLDASDYELQLSLARINKKQAEIAEVISKNEFEREKTLRQEGASSGSQFEQMEFKYKQAKNATALADLNVKIASKNVENAKLRAPYNCVVATQYKYTAERVSPEMPVFDIYEINSIEVHLNAPEIMVGKLSVGTKLNIKIPSVNYVDEAVVSKIVPIVSEQTRTFKVMATLKRMDSKVIPGLFAEAHIN